MLRFNNRRETEKKKILCTQILSHNRLILIFMLHECVARLFNFHSEYAENKKKRKAAVVCK